MGKDPTIRDIIDTMTQAQKNTLCLYIGAACNISKTLGLPANCLTNIIMGHTKKITYGRLCWICTALNITEEDIING